MFLRPAVLLAQSLRKPCQSLLRSGFYATNAFGQGQAAPGTGWWQSMRLKMAAQRETFREKRTEYIVKYGGSFFVVHELLGISSYVVVYTLVSTGILDIWKVVGYAGWKEKDLEERLGNTWRKFQAKTRDLGTEADQPAHGDVAGSATTTVVGTDGGAQEMAAAAAAAAAGAGVAGKERSKLMNFAITVVIVKTLDVLGLVPLRYMITLAVTPRVARVIGPSVDRFIGRIKSLLFKRRADK